jgi:hypothetical protein
MRYSIHDYRLPANAGLVDRGTLSAWKAWVGWVRPAIAVTALMVLGHLLVSWLVGVPSSDARFDPYRFLVRWASMPSAPLTSPYVGETYGPSVLWWAIGAQFAAAVAAVGFAFVLIRRHRRPALIGALGGAAATVLHLSVAGLWTTHPLGELRSPFLDAIARGLTNVTHVYLGSSLQNALAVAALWSPTAFGALAGWWISRRRTRRQPATSGA